jgi:hypothetical protein
MNDLSVEDNAADVDGVADVLAKLRKRFVDIEFPGDEVLGAVFDVCAREAVVLNRRSSLDCRTAARARPRACGRNGEWCSHFEDAYCVESLSSAFVQAEEFPAG